MKVSNDSPRHTLRRGLLSKHHASRFQFGMLFILTLALAVPAVKGLFATGAAAAEPSAETIDEQVPPADKPADAASPAGQNMQREITKLIPNQKVLQGSPPTVIDLDGLFGDTEVVLGGGPLIYEIAYNKKDSVGDATIDGSRLILKWGKVGSTEITLRVRNEQTGRLLDNRVNAEVWQPDYWMLALTVIGGLGIFLLGMKNMSEGLQAVAGAGLRRMISAVTDNRLMATGVGCLVTMLIQSSSITTVMVVGFVNSGFMTLSQAIGVIMGANIGTTITGWILALKIGKYGLPMLGAAAFAYLFSRRDRVHFVAMAVMGLGMVFFGLELMKDGFSIVKDLPAFEAWFATFAADTYFGVLKCAVVGCAVTFIVQSSSATLGITISLAVTGVISVQTAGALVLGENIGTTITAFLASFGATVNAKRAAYYHMVFNIMGVAWITAIFVPFYFPFIQWFVENSVDVLPGIGDGPEATIAMTHSIFNIANTILFLPFVQVFARLLQRVVPQRAKEEKPHLTSLDIRMLETSAIAIEQSRVEVLRMANGCNKMAGWLREILTQDVPDQKIVQKTFHREEVLDAVQDEIVAFMAHLLSGNISLEVSEEARRQVRMADEYESVSDYLANVLKSHLKLEQAGLRFSQDDMDKLLQLHDMVAEYLDMIGTACRQRVPEIITKAHSQGHAITLRVKELRERFLRKMSEERLDAQLIVAYTAQLNAYRRVREHVLNIAEALAGEK